MIKKYFIFLKRWILHRNRISGFRTGLARFRDRFQKFWFVACRTGFKNFWDYGVVWVGLVFIWMGLSCVNGILDTVWLWKATYFPRVFLSWSALVYLLYQTFCQLQNVFENFFCRFFWISLFISSNIYKGKAAHVWISANLA